MTVISIGARNRFSKLKNLFIEIQTTENGEGVVSTAAPTSRIIRLPLRLTLSNGEAGSALGLEGPLFYPMAIESQPFLFAPAGPDRNGGGAGSERRTRCRPRPPAPVAAHSRRPGPAPRSRCDYWPLPPARSRS